MTDFSPADVREWVRAAAESLSLPAQQALLRAFEGDDTMLLGGSVADGNGTKRPTNTTWPGNRWQGPRTMAAGYDARSMTLFVRFRGRKTVWKPTDRSQFEDGTGYEYYGVTPAEWERFKKTPSPGRMINDVFNGHPYTPAAW
ncbi:KTSC domain-containing protein [Kitasatospora purpeofusca]|uniref:KTSC domain-containing protein n=1 Tax=Kitasatospora purpeofusca TaxID=67352 RepID=UPI0036C7F46A